MGESWEQQIGTEKMRVSMNFLYKEKNEFFVCVFLRLMARSI